MKNPYKSLLYFHQGWTDIVNCLPLIHYYSRCKTHVKVIMRDDAYEIAAYTCGNLLNVEFEFIEKEILDETKIIGDIIPNINEYEILFHGINDVFRKDKYKNAWKLHKLDPRHFVKKLYELYGISLEECLQLFKIKRDFKAEMNLYKSFTTIIKTKYIIIHEPDYMELKFGKKKVKLFNVDQMASNPFIWIKILESADEIHLADSFWASAYYLMRYNNDLNNEQTVIIYPINRDGGLWAKKNKRELFTNWKFKPKKCIF